MKSILTKAGVTLALTCALALMTFAQTPAQGSTTTQPSPAGRGAGHGGRHKQMGQGMHGGFGRRAFKGLNLTDAQREQMRAIHERNGGEGFKTQRTELRQLMETRRNGGTLTPEQTARAQELRTQLRANAEKLHGEMLGVLTPEQREQLKQEREQFKQRKAERRERRPDAPPSVNPPTNN
jgi:Spy/CpxP family protein refolding chaperone